MSGVGGKADLPVERPDFSLDPQATLAVRKLQFKVEAHDEDKKVGVGIHRRAIIAIQREG